MAGFPIEIVNTTFLFLFFAFLASLVNLYLKRAKALSRDNVQLCCLSIIVATICLWIMWLCTWLHQWHPLIVPTLPSAQHDPVPSDGSGGGHL